MLQYHFYEKALFASPDVFQEHKNYDEFVELLKEYTESFMNKDKEWIDDEDNARFFKLLDESIEARARHYTSNLVRIGLATEKRKITSSGNSFYDNKINKDSIEKILPIDNTNLILFRQLLKLRIFTKKENGKHKFYSPFYMALYLLLSNDKIEKDIFVHLIQGSSPYMKRDEINYLFSTEHSLEEKEKYITKVKEEVIESFQNDSMVSKEEFSKVIKNRKSGKTEKAYFEFYKVLYKYYSVRNDENYFQLRNVYLENKDKIRKAFCYGKTLFVFGNNGLEDHALFKIKNEKNPFLTTKKFNSFFYTAYQESKKIDIINEYSDTTMRMLGATALIKTKSPLIELSYKSVLRKLFDMESLQNRIFGEITEEEYQLYEKGDDPEFGKINSVIDILGISQDKSTQMLNDLITEYSVDSVKGLVTALDDEVNKKFNEYIDAKYPIEKVINLLTLFSDRKNDKKIKAIVNESADIPTIYEYIVGIAWYHLSNKDFNLYDSLNLTLNADFEPEMHAGGGQGDIVIDYEDKSIMLEVTLMNKAAQKRGEWEPVLRHSVNNKVDKAPKDTFTFFIADELDYNTINIWRAVAAVPLQSSNGEQKSVDGVIIMPFNNSEIIKFLSKKIDTNKILEETKVSYGLIKKITDDNWRKNILLNLNI